MKNAAMVVAVLCWAILGTAGSLRADAPAAAATAADTNSLTLALRGNLTMKLVLIPAGTFLMGSPENEPNRRPTEGPQHAVTISNSFYMGIYEVTQEQYHQVMRVNPSGFKDKTNPVERVSWTDAMAFCKKLSAKMGKPVRLPTEAEWEYACRAGSTTRFYYGDDNDDTQSVDYAWYVRNGENRTHAVGQKKPNSFGLYDMHGNVWEWCQDWYDEKYYTAESKSDPQGPDSGRYRVLRGGGWNRGAADGRSAHRYRSGPTYRLDFVGIRVVVVCGSSLD